MARLAGSCRSAVLSRWREWRTFVGLRRLLALQSETGLEPRQRLDQALHRRPRTRTQHHLVTLVANIDFGAFKSELFGEPDRLAATVQEKLGFGWGSGLHGDFRRWYLSSVYRGRIDGISLGAFALRR